jgi:rRNA maturation endonuclease Nob1
MTEFNGEYLIADQNGIYKADTSDTDNAGVDNYAIKAHIKTGRVDIYSGNRNRLTNAWINYQTDGDIQLVTTADKKVIRTYSLPYHSGLSGINERRVKFEKGIRNRFFDFKIQNIAGSQLEIDKLTIMLEPVISKRR